MDMMFTIHMQPTSAESSRKATDAYIAAVEGDTHDRAKEARRENMPAGVYMTSKHVDRAQDAEELKKEVQFGGHKLFYTTMSAHVRAETPDDLKLEQIPKLQRACGRWGVSATPLSGRERQKDAMNATLPIGKNFINAPSTMTTANVGALIPFTSRRYQDPGGIYWGVDAESEDFIMLDRTALGAPHQMVFGITGSGKSFGLCRENLQILLRRPRAKVYIASPGLAYKPFVQLLGGKWFEVGAGSKDYFNVSVHQHRPGGGRRAGHRGQGGVPHGPGGVHALQGRGHGRQGHTGCEGGDAALFLHPGLHTEGLRPLPRHAPGRGRPRARAARR
ncbi:MAG: hypothetical protein ACLS9I_01960 [Adlercreutzia equolifaciens]